MGRIGVEVQFEWVHGKKKRELRERGEYQSPPGRPVSIASVDGLGIPDGGCIRSVSPDMRSRPRRDSKRSASPAKRNLSSSDSGDESDPEDSETPWSCTLRIIPLDRPTPGSSPTKPLKLRLAHLIPAPHHPKVIGQSLQFVPRSANDSFGMDRRNSQGMVLSAEEIKDVVCMTVLWLMVREGFGGLEGKKRKGDGWKVRS